MGFRIQRYSRTITVPLGANMIKHTPSSAINGILKGVTVTPPASITGSSYGIKILDYAGQEMFGKDTLSAGSVEAIFTDTNNNYINIPVVNNADVALIEIDIAGDTTPTGVLTGTNAGNATDGKTVTIGDVIYRLKTVPTQAYDVFIGSTADDTLTSLAHAINADGTVGVDYFAGTLANPYVTSSTVSSHAITVTALEDSAAENAVATTTNEPTYSWGDTTLADGGEAADANFNVDLYIER